MSLCKRVLYLGGGREVQETLEKAKSLGLEVVYIQHKEKFKDSLLYYVDQVALIDYQQPEILIPIARTLQSLFPFSVALSLSEDALVPAAQVCKALDLPGNSLETVQNLNDKERMRQHLTRIGFSPVAAAVGGSLEDLHAFARQYSLPIIVKPVNASGSLGVSRVETVEQLPESWQRVQELELPRFLMEEYLEGPEISVEAFSFHGNHVILACTDKLTLPNFVEIGHSIPADLDSETQNAVVRFVTAFLKAIDLQEGPSHTELKLTQKGLRIIESHNRPGGDRINEMVRAATGFDMKSMAFAWSCGLTEPLMKPPAIQSATAIRFFAPAPGVVTAILGAEEAAQSKGILEFNLSVQAGDHIRPIQESYDRVGYVLATGASVREAIENCEQALKKVVFVTG